MAEVARLFGLVVDAPGETAVTAPAWTPCPGTVVWIRGPSGAGKTSLLGAIARRWPHARLLDAVPFPRDRAIIDAVAPRGDLNEAAALLTACALGEPALWLRRIDELSAGEQLRARLARAISLLPAPRFGPSAQSAARLPSAGGRPPRGRGARDARRFTSGTSDAGLGCPDGARSDASQPAGVQGEWACADTAHARAVHCAVARAGAIGAPLLLCDEFAAVLHRRAARAIAFNLRKLATRRGLCLVVATSHDDLAWDLDPDLVVSLQRGGATITWPRRSARRAAETGSQRPRAARQDAPPCPAIDASAPEPPPAARRFSLARGARVEPGRLADYQRFAAMHYRQRERVGFVDRVFCLFVDGSDEPMGVVVYGYAPLELALRNRATGGRYAGRPDCLNREVRMLKRLVIHPDLRGCGLGHWLVRQTLPLVGVPVVECLANLGAMNPVFERAGMVRIGQCEPPPRHRRLLAELARLGADPGSPQFERQVARRPALHRLVARTVREWYLAHTTAEAADRRVRRQPAAVLARTFRQIVGSRPVYYLWTAPKRGARLVRTTGPPGPVSTRGRRSARRAGHRRRPAAVPVSRQPRKAPRV